MCTAAGDTDNYGDATQAIFGLYEIWNCASSSAYADCAQVSTGYIGPEPFKDSFESGTFSLWTGESVTSGETRSIISYRGHHGMRSAYFTSNGGGGTERSYAYRNIVPQSTAYARGYFYVSQNGASQTGDRFQMISFYAGSNAVAYVGWIRTSSGLRWYLSVRNGTSFATVYSPTAPILNQWYSVELRLLVYPSSFENGYGGLYVNGVNIANIYGANTGSDRYVSQVRMGLPELYSCSTTRVYLDCAKIARSYIGIE